MKSVIFALVTIAALSAQAAKISCRDVAGGPDHGYTVTVDSQTKEATIEEQTIAGAKLVATLNCTFPKTKAPGPDQFQTVASCSEKELRDAGYALNVSSGGFAGITRAVLSEVTFMGNKPVAKFVCK